MADANGSTKNPSRDPHRWAEEFPTLTKAARELLHDYSHIPADQVEDHVKAIREKAFAIHPYPCIGHVRFLELGLHTSQAHDEVVSRVRSGQKYLDLGCCFGQEIRYLASQRCPSDKLYGADLRQDFIDFGYDLFQDRSTLKATFLAPADIFEEEPLSTLDGTIDIVNASSFFHLFSWDESMTVAKRVVKFLKPLEGSLIIGRQVGRNSVAGPKDDNETKSAFRHSYDTWVEMWNKVGEATGSKWDVKFWWDETAKRHGSGNPGTDNIQRFGFVIRRL